MGSIASQVIVPLALSIITTLVLENVSKLGLGPILTFVVAASSVIVLLFPVLYLRFIGAALQSPGVWRVSGNWESVWQYRKGDNIVRVGGKLRVTQWGSFVFGSGTGVSRSPTAPFSKFRYKFQGILNGEGVIEGKWQNVDTGRVYYGVFQMKIARSCKEVAGFWIGSAKEELNCGDWSWLQRADEEFWPTRRYPASTGWVR